MASDEDRIGEALALLETEGAPSLEDLAAAVDLSPSHFQRLFRRWVGVSPKRYQQARALERAKPLLRGGESVLESALGAGLSGPGRLHDLFVQIEAVTPGEYKSLGEHLELRFGVHLTPLGPCCLALSPRGLSALYFLPEASPERARRELAGEWPGARLVEDPESTGELAFRIFHPLGWDRDHPFHLFLKGTNLQVQVWRALLEIPPGSTTSYSDLAESLGRPRTACRAVAGAVGRNAVSFLIPCHRVLRRGGALGGFRWGLGVKQSLLAAEGIELGRAPGRLPRR